MNPAGAPLASKIANMKVLIPTPLRHYTGKQATVELRARLRWTTFSAS